MQLYERRPFKFRVYLKNDDRPVDSIDVHAYPLREEFFPPFKWVLHRAVVDYKESSSLWSVAELGTTCRVGLYYPTIKEALHECRKTLIVAGKQKTGYAIAKAMGLT